MQIKSKDTDIQRL